MPGEFRLKSLFNALVEFPDIAAAVCRATSQGKLRGEKSVKEIASASGISQGRCYKVEKLLESGEPLGIFKKCSETIWSIEDGFDFPRLAAMFEGATLYSKSEHHRSKETSVVLTLPPSPSHIEAALDKMGFRSAFLENTQDIFTNLAQSAEQRFLVMTPFVDHDGGKKLVDLFTNVSGEVTKQLIVRCPDGVAPVGLKDCLGDLISAGVIVFNYWVPKIHPGAYETFHAKVLLADSNRCYVGSANMTQASLGVSMELGFLAEGEADVS